MAVELASAYLTLVPTLSGASKAISKELGGPAVAREADRAGRSVGGKWAAAAGKAIAAGTVVAGAAVGAFTAYGVKEFAKFEKGMNEVFTLMPGMSKQAMSAMQDDTRAFAREMGITANEVVPALYQSISAGVPKENVFNFLETAQKAAMGGVTDLATAVDGISSVVNAYGEEVVDATKASDLMFTAVKLGKTDFDQLSSSLFNVTPTAAALGVEFGDVTAALAAMTAQGVPTSVATTQLRQLLVEVSKDGGETAKVFQEIAGKSFKQFVAEGGNVNDALTLLGKHAKDSDVGINDLFGSVEAGSAALALFDNQSFVDALAEMDASAGATDAAYAQMDQGLGRTWEKIKATFNDAALSAGETLGPALQDLATWFGENLPGAVEKVSSWIADTLVPAVKDLAGWVKDDLVPALTDAKKWFDDNKAVIGFLASTVAGATAAWLVYVGVTKTVTAVTRVVTAAQWLWNAALTANPIGIIVVAIGAFVGALIWLYQNNETARKIIDGAWKGIKSAISAVADWWTKTAWPNISKVITYAKDAFLSLADSIGSAWADIQKGVASPVNFVIGTVYNNGIRKMWNTISDKLGLSMKLPLVQTLTWGARTGGGARGGRGTATAMATGGVLPGYTPGRDVHEFYSPTAGRLLLSGGEAIMRPEFTRAVGGPAGVEALNRAARQGHAFAGGGVIDWLGNITAKVTNSIGRIISDPAGAIDDLLSKPAESLLRNIGGGEFGSMIAALPKRAISGVIEWAKSNLFGGGGSMGSMQVRGVSAMSALVKQLDPTARITSGYRPGATTVTGFPSYHGMGRAIDFVSPNMGRTFDLVRAAVGASAKELFYSGRAFLRNGKPGPMRNDHWDHIHLAMANGGVLPRLYDQGGWMPHGGVGVNLSGRPEAVLTPAESSGLKAALARGPLDLSDRTIDKLAVRTASLIELGATKALDDDYRRGSVTRSTRGRRS